MSNAVEQIAIKGHESVTFFQDPTLGFSAIIAVHNTVLGPSLGGCRMRTYPTMNDALTDVLNLSEAMSFKNSLAGLNLGGGKSVIIKDGAMTDGRDALFRRFGEFVESLGGAYITAEDMGTSVHDMMQIGKSTKHVSGTDIAQGGSGDPSPWTALGVFLGIRACVERSFGNDSLSGRHVAVQGVGHVGAALVKLLSEAGAVVTICDTKREPLDILSKEYGAKIVGVNDIFGIECDVFAPCAAGGAINENTIGKLRCRIVAGAANNQIAGAETERKLIERGIWYAPDFAINAGGVISVGDEVEFGNYSPDRVKERVTKVGNTVGRILDQAKSTGELPGTIAVRLARERIARGK